MAAIGRLSIRYSNKTSLSNSKRCYGSFKSINSLTKLRTVCACAVTGGLVIYAATKWKEFATVHALRRAKDEQLQQATKLTARERRFIRFASTEFDNQLYMTPQDFLDSVVEQDPRPRLKRRQLTLSEVQALKSSTPPLKKGSHQMFRTLREKGIISYTEYLFLLSILTKPQSGFKIAFNMFDTDGNQRVDKMEFLVIRRLLGGSMEDRELDEGTRKAMERIFSYAYRGRRGMESLEKENPSVRLATEVAFDDFVDDDQGLQRKHKVDTTLQIHFFGKNGKDDLRYEGFRKFMENLQYEVLELEYQEYAKGHETITEVDFAQILLRYTQLDGAVYDMYLERLLDRVKDQHQGITFQEFKDFCEFLNNLEDFAMAMKMYTLADHPISKEEFFRAVKICTGNVLTKHVVNTVFAIFDNDGDGLLSYQEFVAIMKDRLHRGFKSGSRNEGWEAFKMCLKSEMKKNT